jgi:hypothetical protein
MSPKQASLQTFFLSVDRVIFEKQLHDTALAYSSTGVANSQEQAVERQMKIKELNKVRQQRVREKLKRQELAQGLRDPDTGESTGSVFQCWAASLQ